MAWNGCHFSLLHWAHWPMDSIQTLGRCVCHTKRHILRGISENPKSFFWVLVRLHSSGVRFGSFIYVISKWHSHLEFNWSKCSSNETVDETATADREYPEIMQPDKCIEAEIFSIWWFYCISPSVPGTASTQTCSKQSLSRCVCVFECVRVYVYTEDRNKNA